MSFGFSGGFWPMGLPLFHASLFSMTAMIDSLVINRSLIFRFGEKRLLSEIMLYACCRPQPVTDRYFSNCRLTDPFHLLANKKSQVY